LGKGLYVTNKGGRAVVSEVAEPEMSTGIVIGIGGKGDSCKKWTSARTNKKGGEVG